MKSKISFKINIKEATKVIRILSNNNELRILGVIKYMPTRILDLIGKKQKVNLTYLDNDPLYFKWIWRHNFNPSRKKCRLLVALYLAK